MRNVGDTPGRTLSSPPVSDTANKPPQPSLHPPIPHAILSRQHLAAPK